MGLGLNTLKDKTKLDKLTFKLTVEIKKAFINISKHKRILTPVINSSIDLYINDFKLDADEVFRG